MRFRSIGEEFAKSLEDHHDAELARRMHHGREIQTFIEGPVGGPMYREMRQEALDAFVAIMFSEDLAMAKKILESRFERLTLTARMLEHFKRALDSANQAHETATNPPKPTPER